jgi:hypothetical protein
MNAAYSALWRSVFLLALALELPMVALVSPRERRWWAVLSSLVGNAITHPLLWFVWPRLLPYGAAVITGELVAVAVEGALIAFAIRSRSGFAIALLANAYSWLVGDFVMRVVSVRAMHFWYAH